VETNRRRHGPWPQGEEPRVFKLDWRECALPEHDPPWPEVPVPVGGLEFDLVVGSELCYVREHSVLADVLARLLLLPPATTKQEPEALRGVDPTTTSDNAAPQPSPPPPAAAAVAASAGSRQSRFLELPTADDPLRLPLELPRPAAVIVQRRDRAGWLPFLARCSEVGLPN